MKTIYKSAEKKKEILALYDSQLSRLEAPWRDVWIETSYGKTHLIETGDTSAPALLMFHGGNATTAHTLLACGFLLKDFHVYAVDMIGHPGKSAETCLPARGPAYGKWAAEVIDSLNVEKIRCFGGSFGAGVLVKAMCEAPEKIEKAALYVPAGLHNAPAVKSIAMLAPMLAYWATHQEKWLKKALMPMAVSAEGIDPDTFETAKRSIEGAKVKMGMPSNAKAAALRKCTMPVLVMAGEKDCLFPARGVLPRAKKLLPHCTAYLLKGRGHMNRLTAEEERMIVKFLK